MQSQELRKSVTILSTEQTLQRPTALQSGRDSHQPRLSIHPRVNKSMITVIGGSGFIGTNLCQLLADQQVAFEIVDLKQSRRFPDKTKIADIRDYRSLLEAVTGTTIVNLAAVHRDDVRDPDEYYSTNVDGVRNICRLADARSIERIIFTSTVAVYGFAAPETDEEGAIAPFNHYGKSKHQGEEVLRDWRASSPESRSLSIVRPTVVFGEGNRGNVYNLLNQIAKRRFLMIGSGKNRKSMAYVGNVSAFISSVLDRPPGYYLHNYVDKPDLDMNRLVALTRSVLGQGGRHEFRLPYPLGLLVGYLADLIARLTGRSFPVSSIRVRKFCTTTSFSSNIAATTDFTPPFSLEDALNRTLRAEFIEPDANREVFFTE